MRVLVIAPHPDDETLGPGGTLLKHRASGDKVCWLIATKGHQPEWSAASLRMKEQEIEQVAAAYGFENVFRLDFPAVRTDTLPLSEVIGAIRRVVDEARPDCLYVNHDGDVHSDHRVVFRAAMSALKPFATGQHGVRRILSYETLSSTDAASPGAAGAFVPNVFSDITPHIDRKLEIMSLYQTELQPHPLPRSRETIRALAKVRGATIGADYAEAFRLIRQVE